MSDLIDRQAAIEAIAKAYPMNWNDTDAEIAEQDAWRDAKRIIEDLPAIQPVAKDINVLTNDCISRQMAIDTIMGQPPEPYYPSWYAAQIEKLPAAQPEIIRCKDCRFNDGTAYCVFHFRDVKGEDYCSWAERRTDG